MTLVNPVFALRTLDIAPYLALLKPPSYTRLEPQSFTGDPAAGLAMPIADPLWMLHRQWQFGEFVGEDAGSAVDVTVAATAHRLTGWRPGPPGSADWAPLSDVLEPTVEREPTTGGASLRARADAAAVLVGLLNVTGNPDLLSVFLAQAPLTAPVPTDPFDAGAPRLLSLTGSRLPDAETVALALEAAAPGLPAWLPADPDLTAALGEWLAFYREDVAPPPVTDESWVTDRLEYSFAVAGAAPDGVVLEADEHLGGPVEWHTFDLSEDPPPDVIGATEPVKLQARMLATRLRYAGMPANRLWEFEDAAVNLGAVGAEPHDLARLLLIEYAMTAGTDWLIVPLDAPHASVTRIDDLTYTTVFGESYRVEQAGAAIPGDHWRMFTVTPATPADGPPVPADRPALPGLVVPPALLEVAESAPLEDVIFFRDETANLVWAVERTVTPASGDPRSRRVEPSPEASRTPGSVPGVELDYALLTTVPAGWVPFVPAPGVGARAVDVLRARLGDVPDGSLGQLLNAPLLTRLRDGEVPREGVAVRRVTALARRADGGYVRWVTRRVSTGLGEGSSALAYDSALPHA
jgi:hypothetical protein